MEIIPIYEDESLVPLLLKPMLNIKFIKKDISKFVENLRARMNTKTSKTEKEFDIVDLKRDFDSSILLITHNLGVVAELADKVAVMYAGKIVEYSDVFTIFKNPLHPYTQALLSSIPRTDIVQTELDSIPGIVPSLIDPPSGCRFHTRCKHVMEICKIEEPKYFEVKSMHYASCHLLSSEME